MTSDTATTIRTAGVDLAAADERTALAVLAWSSGGARLERLSLGVSDAEIVAVALTGDRIGIDCALGWPDEFVAFLTRHADPDQASAVDGGAAWRQRVSYRESDRAVRQSTGRWPLSVATDRLGVTALRCAGLLARLGEHGVPIDRSGLEGAVAEVYPGATLRLWEIDTRGYRVDPGARRALLDQITRRAPWLDLCGHEDAAASSPDAFDAIVAALATRAVHLGRAAFPPPALRAQARREGWVLLPTCRLEELVD